MWGKFDGLGSLLIYHFSSNCQLILANAYYQGSLLTKLILYRCHVFQMMYPRREEREHVFETFAF